MNDQSNWQRFYFNRQMISGRPELPARLNLRLTDLKLPPRTVAIQLEYPAGEGGWKSKRWTLAPIADLREGLEVACRALAADLRSIDTALCGPKPFSEFSIFHITEAGAPGQLSLALQKNGWTFVGLDLFGTQVTSALRDVFVSMMKARTAMARAVGLPDKARTQDIIDRINARLGQKTAGGKSKPNESRASEAFFGDRLLREQLLTQLKEHQKQGRLVQNSLIWSGEFGSAVGCAIYSEDFADYELKYGIPFALACLKEILFQKLSPAEAKKFPVDFVTAAHAGADLSNVWKDLLVWLLADPRHGLSSCLEKHGYWLGSGYPLNKKPFEQLEAAAKLLRENCIDKQRWQKILQEANHFKCSLPRRALELDSFCDFLVLMVAVSEAGGTWTFETISAAINVLIEALAQNLYSGCGHDGPMKEECYPRFYTNTQERLLLLMAASPVVV
ncbi:MAG: hypothetical protein K2W82_16960 [Candidatus Obscuribacterales bacterium]|nr:hypothetical protein [Candidatus Obscuribacterales bacterium]